MTHEARRLHLWSVHGVAGQPKGWTNKEVKAVVLQWGVGGYKVIQQHAFIAKDVAHAHEVAKGAFRLWCTVNGVEEGVDT